MVEDVIAGRSESSVAKHADGSAQKTPVDAINARNVFEYNESMIMDASNALRVAAWLQARLSKDQDTTKLQQGSAHVLYQLV